MLDCFVDPTVYQPAFKQFSIVCVKSIIQTFMSFRISKYNNLKEL